MKNYSQVVETEQQMLKLAASFSSSLQVGDTVYLNGDLGSGKTTFVRGVLSALGCQVKVVSPTYALVESYMLKHFKLRHIDLYRLNEVEELDFIEFRDYFNGQDVIMIEWPERALELLPKPDYDIHIKHNHQHRIVEIKPKIRQ